jgi:hypothetical protein
VRGFGREGVGLARNRLSEGVSEGVHVRGHSYRDSEGVGVGGYRDLASFVTNTALGVSGMMGNQVLKSKP